MNVVIADPEGMGYMPPPPTHPRSKEKYELYLRCTLITGPEFGGVGAGGTLFEGKESKTIFPMLSRATGPSPISIF